MKDCRAWATLYGLSLVTACGPSVRQQALCDLQKNVGQLEQRLRHSEAHARALDERLVVLGARSIMPDTPRRLSAAPTAMTPLAEAAAATPAAQGAPDALRPGAPASLSVTSKAPEALPRLMPEEGISLSEGQSLAAGPSIRLHGRAKRAGPQPADAMLPKRLQQALKAYQQGAFTRAFGQFQDFVQRHPDHAAADRARFWMGECKFEAGLLMESIAQFARLEREHPKSAKAPEALLKMGLAFEKLAAPQEAFATYRRLIHSFPKSASAELASSRLAQPPLRGPAS